jgi:hypothetical protein
MPKEGVTTEQIKTAVEYWRKYFWENWSKNDTDFKEPF